MANETDDVTATMGERMGNGFMLEVFMIEVTLRLARQQPDPQAWARGFVSACHARLDVNEGLSGQLGVPIQELARQGFDRLGQHLARSFQTRPR